MTDAEYAELDLAVARAEIAADQTDVRISDASRGSVIPDGSCRFLMSV